MWITMKQISYNMYPIETNTELNTSEQESLETKYLMWGWVSKEGSWKGIVD